MVLSRKAIIELLDKRLIGITPFDESQVEAVHVNLHLEDQPEDNSILVIEPKQFIVARTKESIRLPQTICGIVEGRSKLAQQGISVEQSSTLIEPGSDNTLALEILNASDQRVVLDGGSEDSKNDPYEGYRRGLEYSVIKIR